MSAEAVGSWPQVEAIVRDDGSGQVTIDGVAVSVKADTLEQARVEVLRRVTEHAVAVGSPVRASAMGPEGLWTLVVHPDGSVVPEDETMIAPQDSMSSAPPSSSEQMPGEPEPEAVVHNADLQASAEENETSLQGEVSLSTTPEPALAYQEIPEPFGEPVQNTPDVVAPIEPLDATLGNASETLSKQGNRHDAVNNGVQAVTTQRENTPGAMQSSANAPTTRSEARASFLTQAMQDEPAEQGFRGWLSRVGVRVGPSEAERSQRADEREVSQHWAGPRTIAIVNGKGGAGKTPSTILLSAVFAQYGGAGVVAWDNNQTRGTLGWRTEKGPHDATLLDLLPRADHLLGPSAQAADLARYVHHQTRDRYDVLRSKPMAMAHEQRIDMTDVDSIHSVLSKYYRLIIMDSGNDESDPMWKRMIEHTDQLVVATTTRDDHAEAGALLLEALAERDSRSNYLARQAVVVVSQADPKATTPEVTQVADGYTQIAREVVRIPFDPGMVDGHLRYGALRNPTKRAWLAAGAAIARGL